MAHEKISDDEILRRADAIKELKRIEGMRIHPTQTIQLISADNRNASHLTTNKQHGAVGSAYAEIVAEVFVPLLQKGLDEYRKRIDAISDGKA